MAHLSRGEPDPSLIMYQSITYLIINKALQEGFHVFWKVVTFIWLILPHIVNFSISRKWFLFWNIIVEEECSLQKMCFWNAKSRQKSILTLAVGWDNLCSTQYLGRAGAIGFGSHPYPQAVRRIPIILPLGHLRHVVPHYSPEYQLQEYYRKSTPMTYFECTP